MAIRHIDENPECKLAEGPFPQGTGTLTCLSRPLARKLAKNPEFSAFYGHRVYICKRPEAEPAVA